MRIRHLALALLLGLGVLTGGPGLVAEPAPEKKVDGRQIAKLVEQLGSGQFDDRERASQALDDIGLPALEALKKAAQNDDPEVRRRAELVVKIEKRTQSARLLAAKRVHLVYKDTPLSEAVADFRKQSGYDLVLTGPEELLKDRTITLDTGDATFWQAMRLFCQKAGLVTDASDQIPQPRLPLGAKRAVGGPAPNLPPPIPANVPPQNQLQPKEQPRSTVKPAEAPQAPPPAPQPGQAARPGKQAVAQVAVQAIAQVGAPGARAGMVQQGQGAIQIVLKPGKQDPVPADTATAVRVRALRPAGVAGPLVDGELRVILQATPEPRLRWGELQVVNVDKAIDDQNQSLTQLVDPPCARMMPLSTPDQEITLRLKQGEKPAKLLKELSGTLSAQVLSAPQALISADNILKAAGKTFKGTEGGHLKINEVTRDANGQVKVRFEMEAPPNAANGNGMANPFGGAIQLVPGQLPARKQPLPGTLPVPNPGEVKPKGMLGAQVVQPAQPVQPGQPVQIRAQIAIAGPVFIGQGLGGLNGLTLQDDKGNAFPQVGTSTSMRRNGNVLQIEYVLTFNPLGAQLPARLVYSASKSFNVEIPFSLKDVPLQ